MLNGIVVTNGYDNRLRGIGLGANHGSRALLQQSFGYDPYSGRLASVSEGGQSVEYAYLGNSPLVETVAFKQNGNLSMTTTKAYDFVNRLTSISSANSAQAVVSRHAYLYNTANQRTRATLADNTYWVYEYDALGQVKSGKKYWSDGTPVAGQQFEYGFDDIGNRKFAGAGGDEWGRGLQFEQYATDLEGLNQYAQRTVPGSLDVLGTANANATVTVNNQPAYRKGEYFHKALSVDNGGSAVWQGVSAVAVLRNGSNTDIVTNYTGNAFVAKMPEQFLYDADGNLTNDGRWTYTWDGENRLIGMEARSEVPSGAKLKLEFAYDYQGRRVSKKVSTWNGSSYQLSTETKFVYDGWNLLAALAPDCTVRTSFTWGVDLSGTMQGAGGVGGLLAVKDQQSATGHFVAYDGNGNVSVLVNAADGAASAQYEYGPFGEVLRATGATAETNPFRFSSKYQDEETGFLYYGYRFYDPSTGRWISRDPLSEWAFFQSYCRGKLQEEQKSLWFESLGPEYTFARNNGIDGIDRFGLDRWRVAQGIVHSYVVVHVWDGPCCKEIVGAVRIDFHLAYDWSGLIVIPGLGSGPGQVDITESGTPSPGDGEFVASNCKQDRLLLQWAIQMRQQPPYYSLAFFNCNVFSEIAMRVGINY